jgi:predicted unusual protein kinase regulating ubiquinone biosynthesis (AarF/ABC1/UbiB family)
MNLDYAILKSITWALNQTQTQRIPRLYENLSEFESSLLDQMNLKNELINIQRFKRNFFNNSKVEIPEPILATNCILIEQFKLGHSLGD